MRNRNDATIRADDLWDLKNCMPLSQRTTLLVARKENIGLTQDSRNFKLVSITFPDGLQANGVTRVEPGSQP